MTEEDRLTLLKADLELLSRTQDALLMHLLKVAEERIQAEGIRLTDSVSDENLRVMYAAYLYRKRTAENTAMPRMLRYALNNRLMKEKGAVGSAT